MARTVAVLVGRDPAWRYSLHRGYADAAWLVGGTPLVLTPPPGGAAAGLVEAVAGCDALLVTGGGDISPTRYGQEPAQPLMDVDEDRDAAELAAVAAAHRAGKPVLGICRGIQLLAVAFGGTLHQDVKAAGFPGSHWEEIRQHEPVHGIEAEPGSLAAAALDGATTVNSIHHQAVDDPGPRLRVSARAPDGLIEAVEADGLLGLQWHPERLFADDPRHTAPFRWLLS